MRATAIRTFATALALAAPWSALGGDFGVSPIRVDLDRATRTTVVKVSNDEAEPLSFQIRVMEWTQDADGHDHYADSNDLVYFPQQMQIQAKDSRVIRIGYRNPSTGMERAYRMYVEELPRKSSPGEPGKAVIDVAVRFGIPIFVRPAVVQEKGELGSLAVGKGRMEAVVENQGPVHFRVDRVAFEAYAPDGQKVYEQVLEGWYLLAGAKRLYSAALPREACLKAARIQVEMVAEKLTLRRDMEVRPELCS